MDRRKGFTLIELLVVISIIALLMAVLIPALQRAKDMARTINCRGNVKNIATAWFMYADDNDGQLAHGDTADYRDDEWAHDLLPGDKSPKTPEDFKKTITTGVLFPYLKKIEVYRCPSDHRYKMPEGQQRGAGLYRSYVIVKGMNGLTKAEDSTQTRRVYKKYTQIKRPADNYVFVEDNYRQHTGDGGWHMDNANQWCSNLAMWHNKKIILGFADGHAEIHKLEDKRTIAFHSVPNLDDRIAAQPGNPDLKWMWEHFPCHEWVKTW